jgi:hypothetical protein
MRRYPRFPLLCWTVMVFATLANPAHAYLDPGTASLILQSILGAIGAGFVILSMYWRKVVDFFKKKKPEDQDLNQSDPGHTT